MSQKSTLALGLIAACAISSGAVAMPMSGTMTGHVDKQNVQPLGGPDKLKIQETASGTNASPGSPLDGAQISISEVVMLTRGQGPVKGTITFKTPAGTATNFYTGTVMTDAQGRVTAKGNMRATTATGAFAGLKGSGTFTVAYTSKTDFTGEWKGNFTPPKMGRR